MIWHNIWHEELSQLIWRCQLMLNMQKNEFLSSTNIELCTSGGKLSYCCVLITKKFNFNWSDFDYNHVEWHNCYFVSWKSLHMKFDHTSNDDNDNDDKNCTTQSPHMWMLLINGLHNSLIAACVYVLISIFFHLNY